MFAAIKTESKAAHVRGTFKVPRTFFAADSATFGELSKFPERQLKIKFNIEHDKYQSKS